MQEVKVLRAALYPRVSTDEQVLHGYSLDAQEEALQEYARANNMKVVGVYRDEGCSARKAAMKRPVMQELLEDVKAGKIDRILFVKLDRWFRNVREYHKVQAILEEHNVTWQAVLEDYSTATADGRLKVNIMLSVAENEADRTSERIKFINEAKRRRKESCTGTVSRGYKVAPIDGAKRVVKDPKVEQYVQDFWDHYKKYESIKLAGLFVNQKYSLNWSYKVYATMAKSEMHSGVHHGIADYCAAYISREEWERLRDFRISKVSTNPSRVYLFSGLLICPGCGNTLKANHCTQTRKDGSRVTYLSYRCSYTRLGTCESHVTASEIKIEKQLLSIVRSELEKFILSADVSSQAMKKRPAAHDLAKLNEQLRRLSKVYIAGHMEDDEYIKMTADIKKKMDDAKQAERDERPPDVEVLREFLRSDFETIYETLSKEDKRRMWRSIIEKIHIKDSKIDSIKFRA